VLYLYGVVPGGQAVPSPRGATLRAVPFGSLVALVELVPSSEFSATELEQKMQRIDWVGPLACKHAAVLEDIMRHGPVVPARLCTLFTSAGSLAGSLAEEAPRFQDALRWLGGRQEWGLKLFCDEGRLRALVGAADPRARALEAAAGDASEGQAYVLRKQRDGRVAAVAGARIEEIAGEVIDTLAELVADTRLRALLSAAVTGRRDAMVMNAAVLADRTAEAALRDAVAELAAQLAEDGFSLELTGPWPPYSFLNDEDAEPEDAEPEDAEPEDAEPEDAEPEDAEPEDAEPEEEL
jgi:hypothetical protein